MKRLGRRYRRFGKTKGRLAMDSFEFKKEKSFRERVINDVNVTERSS